jgi:hypothetical protein
MMTLNQNGSYLDVSVCRMSDHRLDTAPDGPLATGRSRGL